MTTSVVARPPLPQIYARDVQPALRLRKVGKRYVGTVALADVDLDLWRGEIHAVLGENGAGKSTLIKIITGIIEKNTGEILVNGRPIEIGSPQNAARLGITYVPQDILLVPELSIGRNILLGLERRWVLCTAVLSAEEAQKVKHALQLVGANFSPDTPTRDLAVPQLRLAQIARALVQKGDIIVLDEPTAVLAEPDADLLLEKLTELRAAGKVIVYITHRLSEVLRIADRATILRDGRCVGHLERDSFDRAKFVSLMAKENTTSLSSTPTASERVQKAPPVLTATNVTVNGRFQDVTLSVAPGQIVGVAGVQGSGHGHVLQAIAGIDPCDAGTVTLFDRVVSPGNFGETFRMGLRIVPADRRGAGIVADLTNRENIVLGPDVPSTCRPLGFRAIQRERTLAQHHIRALDIRPSDSERPTGTLSGGNQQKIVLARALSDSARVLLVEEPTQGIDVRSRAEIHALLREIARKNGCAVLIASSEFDELIGLADVIHVMRLGRLVATLPSEGTTYHDILDQALS